MLATYLAGCASINDGFDKDTEVGMVLLGAVAFDADAQTCWTRVAEGDLKGQELSGPIWSQDQLILFCLLYETEQWKIDLGETFLSSKKHYYLLKKYQEL